MRGRSMCSLALGLILLASLSSAAFAKPKVAVLGLEVVGSLDPEQVKLAKMLTNALRERAGAGTGPYELAPNSDKELVDEKLMNNCGTEAFVCMAPIGLNMKADYLMYGKIEKVEKGFHVTIKVLKVSNKMPGPTFTDIIPISDIKNDAKGVAKRAYTMMTAGDEGTVTVRVTGVDRATVFLDDQPMGTTSSGVLTIPVPEGKHRLVVTASEKGWNRHEEELTVNPGDQRNIPVELVRVKGEIKDTRPADPRPTGDGTPLEVTKETRVTSSGGSGAWTGIAIAGSVVTLASAAGFGLSWYQLLQIGKAEGDTSKNPFEVSCREEDIDLPKCKDARTWLTASYVTGIAAAVVGGITVYAFYKSSSRKERPVAGGRSTKARRELTVTPVVSAQGGGATLRFDW
jgi:hypothetical protein